MCHEALEALYKARIEGKTLSLEEFIEFYNANWRSNYCADSVKHVVDNYGEDYYRLQGEGMLTRYYNQIFANEDMTVLGVETDDELQLPDGNTYYVRIDKLAYKDGIYYVCDYKTDQKAKEQAVADKDQQLAMYAVWVKQKFPYAKDVKLLWHMLRFDGVNAVVTSSRTSEQLDSLVDDIVSQIKEIEAAEEFPIGNNAHCNYCTYQSICPKFVPKKVLTMDDGIKLVDELVEKSKEKKFIETRIEEIKFELVELAGTGDYEIISGTAYEIPIEKYPQVDNDSSDWGSFKKKVIELGLTDDYCMLNNSKIRADVKKKALCSELSSYLRIYETIAIGKKRKRKNIEED